MPNVLVFESDGSFAGELKGELERRGCSVTVVDDASVGLQTAASDRPDLILLTIELPRMNGFSVCNKLKRDPALKEVPLIIMSSDSTEETFEQHRRLRTHAEDYVHKPITFVELLPRITAHVPLGNGVAAPAAEEDVVIDTDVDFDDAAGLNGAADAQLPDMSLDAAEEAQAAAPEAQLTDQVDDEVDAFTESAFGSLMEEDAARIAADPVAAAIQSIPSIPVDLPVGEAGASQPPMSMDLDVVSLPPSADAAAEPVAPIEDARPRAVSSIPPRPRIEPVDTALRDELARQVERARELEKELREARARVSELEDETSRAAVKDAEVQRLQRELDEAKAKAASGGKGGGSAREFLDLREALNRKDKEILDLRDQITHKEKDLLGLRDANLGVEREKADILDKIEGFEKQASDAARLLDVARADKEQASKRADDFKRKIEKLQSELDAKTVEYDDFKRKADEDRAALEASAGSLRTEIEEATAAAASEKLAAVEEATRTATEAGERARQQAVEEVVREKERIVQELTDNATRDRDQAVQGRELELRREQDAKLAALHRANEDALNRIRAEHTQAIADEKKAGEVALADQESRYAREHEAVVKEHEAGHQATKNELAQVTSTLEEVRREKAEGESQRDLRIESLTNDLAARAGELEAEKRLLEERSAELDAVRATLGATRQELSEAQAALATEQGKTARASSKWTDDRASLERAKDALAAALAQLDEIDGRPLD